MNTAAKGRRLEHRSIALLEASGYSCVRSAGSRGLWDVVGFKEDEVVLVQIRAGRSPSAAELEAMRAFVCPPGTVKLVHVWRPRQPRPEMHMLWG